MKLLFICFKGENLVANIAIDNMENKIDDFPYKKLSPHPSINSYIEKLKGPLSEYIKIVPGKDFPTELISSSKTYELTVLTDFFTEPARMRARVLRNVTPLEYWKAKKRYIIAQVGNDVHEQRELIYHNVREATQFSCVISKIFYDSCCKILGKSRGGRSNRITVMDPFAGWGDRMLGAIGAECVEIYCGVDQNRDLETGYKEIQALDKDKIKFKIEDIRNIYWIKDFDLDSSESAGKFDVCFTSPPYFDFETYNSEQDPKAGHKEYSDWYENFLTPVWDACIAAIKSDGIIAIHISNTSRCQTIEQDTVQVMHKLGMKNIARIGCRTGDKRPIFIYVFRRL